MAEDSGDDGSAAPDGDPGRPADEPSGDDAGAVVARAMSVIPGGAQTGLRAQAFELGDIAFDAAEGTTLWTVDGDAYTDYHLGFGPVVLGHGHDRVDAAVRDELDQGVLYGAGTTPLEVDVAERLVELLPSVEMVNFCNSGTEATYHAVRLARAATGNRTVLKFEGCYHGWHDYLDVSVYPPADRLGDRYPESAGMLPEAVAATEVAPFNDAEAARAAIAEHADDLAAVVVEPIPHSVGCLLPEDGFLEALREATAERDVPLVFDEVITAFRHSPNGVQAELDVIPDLTCVAKALGNGYPVAAVGGRADLMTQAAGDHESGVVISGTYSGHPAGLAAARATLRVLDERDVQGHLTDLGRRYREGLADLLVDHDVEGRVVGHRSIFAPQFGVTDTPSSYADVVGLDDERFRAYARGMFERGHFFTPNPFKRHHLSYAHDESTLQEYLDDADAVLAGL